MSALATDTTFQLIPIHRLRESSRNPRRTFNQRALEELAASVGDKGIITPMIVRPVDDFFEIGAGHRRCRAAKMAGLVEVPCLVREMDDDSFLELLTIENDQREDVHPLEQAFGYRELLGRPGYTVALVAAKIGRTEAFVAGRLRLLDLAPVVQEAFLADRITLGHARAIAMLEPSHHEEALKRCFVHWSGDLIGVSAFKRTIRDGFGRDLARAPFDLEALDLGAVPCVMCSQAVGVNPLLLDADGQKTCMLPECFNRKAAKNLELKKAAGLVVISTKYACDEDGVLPARAYVDLEMDGEEQAELAEKRQMLEEEEDEQIRDEIRQDIAEQEAALAKLGTDCGYAEDAIVGDVHDGLREDLGRVKRICRNPECPVHGQQIDVVASHDDDKAKAERAKREKEEQQRKLKDKARLAARQRVIEEVAADCELAGQGDRHAFCELLVMHFLEGMFSAPPAMLLLKTFGSTELKTGTHDQRRKALGDVWDRLDWPERERFLVWLLLVGELDRNKYSRGVDLIAEAAEKWGLPKLSELEKRELARLKAETKGGTAKKRAGGRKKKVVVEAPPVRSWQCEGPEGTVEASIDLAAHDDGWVVKAAVSLPLKDGRKIANGFVIVDSFDGFMDVEPEMCPDAYFAESPAAIRAALSWIDQECQVPKPPAVTKNAVARIGTWMDQVREDMDIAGDGDAA